MQASSFVPKLHLSWAAGLRRGRCWGPLLLAGCVVACAGCGRGKPSQPTAPGTIKFDDPTVPVPVAAPIRPIRPPPPRPKAPGPDDFEVVGEVPEEEWRLVDPDPRANAFVVSAIAPGQDARSFVLVGATEPVPPPASPPRLLAGFRPAPQSGWADDGFPLRIIGAVDGAEMAYVPAGSFPRGSDVGPTEAGPQQVVFLDAFYIDLTEVTVGRFDKFVDDQQRQKKRIQPPLNAAGKPNQPALGINWGDALNYARWAGKELPTESQWEKAGRGPDGFLHPWGNGRAVWQRPRAPRQIDAVGSFRGDESPYGVFDLAGNAREWCADRYSASAYVDQKAEGPAVVVNPQGPKSTTATQRVVRGGSPDWALWYREGAVMTERFPDLGFRCVLNLAGASPPGKSPAGADRQKKPATKKPSGKGR